MNISQAILWKYPQANPLYDFRVDVVDGTETLVTWSSPDPRPTDTDLQSWWLECRRQQKLTELNGFCQSTIYSGFVGTNGHSYQFEDKDQGNLTQQMVFLVNDPTITTVDWKTTDVGILTHTRDEFFQVCQDANNFKRTNFGKYWQLEANVKAATTEDEINSINW